MEQTAPLTKKKVQVPVVALGGEKALPSFGSEGLDVHIVRAT